MSKPSGGLAPESRPAALYLTPEAPYPLMGGGALRSASLLEYLAQRYQLDVIVFREPGLDPASRFPPAMARAIHVLDLPANARNLPARILRNSDRLLRRVPPLVDRFSGFGRQIASLLCGREYELSVIEHFWCAPYWEQLAPVSRRTVLDLHNIESLLHQRCTEAEPWPAALAHRVFQRACLQLERRWFPCFTGLLVTSESEGELVRAICPESRVAVYPNAIPLVPCPSRAEEDVVVFSGNMEYHPNVSAVRFFRREIWPRLRQRWPGLVWRLVGKNPQAIRRYTRGDERIQVSGPVEDAVHELAAAKVAVAPLLAGSGTRLKIMEAWAAGRPVVSTPLGAEGLPVRDGENILLAGDGASFADAVSALLESSALRQRIGQAGRVLYETQFTWEAAWNCLDL